jgi:hypothetical protein
MSRPQRAILVLLTALAFPVVAQQPPATPATPPPPCMSEPHRQFDFWVGEWEVTNPAGKPAGRSRIEAKLGRCVVHEHWFGTGGSNGESFNLYNAASGQWEQFWVDNGGSRLHLKGGLRDRAMVLEGAQDKADAKTGVVQRERITWTPNADGSVRQLWETSTDEGRSWTVSFDGLYRKATMPVP